MAEFPSLTTTDVDLLLTSEPKIPNQIKKENTINGLHTIFSTSLETYEIDTIGDVLLHRREISDIEILDYPEVPIYKVIRRICKSDLPRNNLKEKAKNLRPIEREHIGSYLFNISTTQQYVKDVFEPLTFPLEKDLHMKIQYVTSDWEGIGGLAFYMSDEKTEGTYFPTYLIRGNPHNFDHTLGFDIRNCQPWISEQEPSLSGIQKSVEMLAQFPEIKNYLNQRERINERIMRQIKKTDPSLSEADVYLSLALTYFQKFGVSYFRGIGHSSHPEAKRMAKRTSKLDYDDTFGKCFDRKFEDGYSWQLNAHNSMCYIPHYSELPHRLQDYLLKLYYSE